MTSEIRTNSLTSRAGLSTVTLTDSGPMFSGITTFVDNSGFNLGTGSSIFTPASNTLTFGTNSNERLRIASNGHVAIGTDSPNSALPLTIAGQYPGIQSGGTTIGAGVTFINFVQSGLTASVASGIATVNLGGKTDEQIQDIVGAMFSGNTETNITVTYQDSDGTIDLEVAGGGKFVDSTSPAAGIHTADSIGINTVGFTTDMVGAGNSFNGMYISNGMTIYDNELNGNHYISTSFNGLMAGPVTVNGVLTVDGNYVVV